MYNVKKEECIIYLTTNMLFKFKQHKILLNVSNMLVVVFKSKFVL